MRPRMALSGSALLGATWCASVTAGPAAGSASPRLTAVTARTATRFDTCLIGIWRERAETDRVDHRGVTLRVTGAAGRILQFFPGGREIVDHTHAARLTGRLAGTSFTITGHASVTFKDRTGTHTLTFVSADFSKLSETGVDGSTPLRLARPTGAAPITCRSEPPR